MQSGRPPAFSCQLSAMYSGGACGLQPVRQVRVPAQTANACLIVGAFESCTLKERAMGKNDTTRLAVMASATTASALLSDNKLQ